MLIKEQGVKGSSDEPELRWHNRCCIAAMQLSKKMIF